MMMEKCLLAGPWVLNGKAIFLKKWSPGMQLTKEQRKSFPIWIKLSNVPIDFWTPMGLSWIANAIGKPLLLDPKPTCMESVDVAKICVVVGVDASFPSSIALQSSLDSSPVLAFPTVVDVEYSWKPIRCGHCLKLGHDVSKCKAKRIFRPSGSLLPNPLPSKSGKDHEGLSKQSDFSNGMQKGIIETSCSANPFSPLKGDVEVDPYSGPEAVDQARLEVLGFDGVLVHSTGVDNLEARKLGNPSQDIGPTVQLAPMSDNAFTEAMTGLLTTLPQADSSSHMENVVIAMGPDINSEHWCLGPQLQSMPVNSQQNLDKLRREPAAPESMEPILMDAEIRWNPGNVACMAQCDAAPILATRPNCMDSNRVEYDDSMLTKAEFPMLSPGEDAHQSCLQQGGLGLDRLQATSHKLASYADVWRCSSDRNVPDGEAPLILQPINSGLIGSYGEIR